MLEITEKSLRKMLQLFLVDVGLLSAMSDLDVRTILDGNNIFVEFKGALTEQFVLQELVAGAGLHPYYCVAENGSYELDFIVQKEGQVLPIEVKANVSRQGKSLKFFCAKYGIKEAVLFSMLNYEQQSQITNIPLYGVCTLW